MIIKKMATILLTAFIFLIPISLVLSLFLFALSLNLVLNITKITKSNYKASLKISAIFLAINALVVVSSVLILSITKIPFSSSTNAFFYLFDLIASVCIFHFLMKRNYATKVWKNIRVFFLTIFVYGIINLLVSFLIVAPVRMFVFEPFVIQGSSMSPNLDEGKYFFIGKIDKNYLRGDVVVFK